MNLVFPKFTNATSRSSSWEIETPQDEQPRRPNEEHADSSLYYYDYEHDGTYPQQQQANYGGNRQKYKTPSAAGAINNRIDLHQHHNFLYYYSHTTGVHPSSSASTTTAPELYYSGGVGYSSSERLINACILILYQHYETSCSCSVK